MNLRDVMDQVATQLDTIVGLRVYAWPAAKIVPPAAVVTYPETIEYSATYGRGTDTIVLPVVLLVGQADQRSTRDRLGKYCNGSGADSVVAVLEAGTYTAFDTLHVSTVDFEPVRMAGVEYMAALFSINISGQGG